MFASITGTMIYEFKKGRILKARLIKFYAYLSSRFGDTPKVKLSWEVFISVLWFNDAAYL